MIKAGYDEDEVFETDRSELLCTYAEYLFSPPIPESPENAEGGAVPLAAGMSAEEREFRKQEVGFKIQQEDILQQEYKTRKQELELEKEKQKKEEERR